VIAICDLSVAYVWADGFKGVNDLTGQKVACLHGYDIQRLLPVEIKPQTVYDLTSAILMLDRGHAKFVIDDAALLKEAIRETKIPSNTFGIAPLMRLDIVPVFSPDEKGRRLRDIYDRRMREMIASGELQRIMQENGLDKVGIQNVLKANGF
jgi:ABC-type amino acid transport substrate-binding protein